MIRKWGTLLKGALDWIDLVRGLGQKGSAIVFAAVITVPLFGFMGLATDAARGYFLKARLSQGIDAAGLAGARVIHDSTQLNQDITMYFQANFPNGYMDATVSGPTYTVDAGEEIINVQASATIPTVFMRLFGINDLTVSAETEVTRKTNYLDVVLSMDMSGSMGWDSPTRISSARTAAKELVSVLFGTNETKELLKIGLVPWNGKVNVKTQGLTFNAANNATTPITPAFKNPLTGVMQNEVHTNPVSHVPFYSALPVGWKGCVYARFLNDSIDNDADIFEADKMGFAVGDWLAWEPVGVEGEPVSGSDKCTSSVSNNECTPCQSIGITPLQDTKTTMNNAIDALTSPGGVTNIPMGLAWAWRVLTPEAPFTQADPSPPGPRIQAIILLTDGQNWGGSGDGYKATFGVGEPRPEMDARLRLLAANIKANGVLIYTIQFANNSGSLATLMKDVASAPGAPYYHFAPDAATLKTVFTEVANNLSELRISK